MSEDAVIVRVSGFTVSDAIFEDDELSEAAREIATDVGMALASLGSSAGGGTVRVELLGREASSDD